MSDTATPAPESAAPAAPTAPAAPPVAPTPPPAPKTAVAVDPVVTLAVVTPFQLHGFAPGVEGWGTITRDGTEGPAATADEAIAAGVVYDIVIERKG